MIIQDTKGRRRSAARAVRAIRAACSAALALAVMAVLAPRGSAAPPPVHTAVVAVTGQTAPDVPTSSFTLLIPRDLNNAGQVSFVGILSGIGGSSGENARLYRSDATFPSPTPAALTNQHRFGQPAPDGNGSFTFIPFDPHLNHAGAAAYLSNLSGTAGGATDNTGVYRAATAGRAVQIAREGQSLAGGGNLTNLNENPVINLGGQVAFTATPGVFVGSGGALTAIVRTGQLAPDGLGAITPVGGPNINDAGQVAFRATSGGESIFRGDGGVVTRVARVGQVAPGGNGTFSDLYDATPVMNASGQVAFLTVIMGTDGGLVEKRGMYRGTASNALTQIAREDQVTAFGAFGGFSLPDMNNAGRVAFAALINGGGPPFGDSGIYRTDGTTLVQVARNGQAAPGGNGAFAVFDMSFDEPTINEAGQVAFMATLGGTAGGDADDRGLFVYADAFGLVKIAREGDLLLGSAITELAFPYEGDTAGARMSGFNDAGQVAYLATLADGRQVIALATVPEPAGAAVYGIALGVVGLGWRRGRRRPTV